MAAACSRACSPPCTEPRAMPFVPDASVLLAYSLAAFVLFITPGPDMSLFLAKTFIGGRQAGIAAMTGASLGNVVHSVLAAFGLSALIAASPTLFLALKPRHRRRTQRLLAQRAGGAAKARCP